MFMIPQHACVILASDVHGVGIGMRTRKFSGRKSSLGINGSILASSLALNVMAMLMPIAILLVFDRVIPNQSTETLKALALVLLAVAGMEFMARWSRSTVLGAAASDAAVTNHNRFLSIVVGAKPGEFAGDASALHLERYAALARLRDYYAGQNQALAIDLPFTAVFIAMIGLIGGWLILVPLSGLFAVVTFALLMKRAQWSLFDKRKTLDARRYTFLSEVLSNMMAVKANTMERQLTQRFEMLQDQTVETSGRLIKFSGFAQAFGAVFAQFSVAAMGLFGAYLVVQGFIGIAELAACMLLNGRVIQPLMKLMSHWVQSESTAVAKRKLNEMRKFITAQAKPTALSEMQGSVAFDQFTLGRAVSHDPVNAKINPGDIVLVESGNPRQTRTFLDCVAGHVIPEAGEIVIDGVPAPQIGRGQNQMVVLDSHPVILSGTLLENLSAFGDAAQCEIAKGIASKLRLETRIHRLPLGYNTPLNTGTSFEKDPVNRQLIAITRALSLKPKILILNEPSAVLDTPERDAFSACLDTLDPKPTIFMATPDPRLKRLATRTIDLDAAIIEAWDSDLAQEQAATQEMKRGAA